MPFACSAAWAFCRSRCGDGDPSPADSGSDRRAKKRARASRLVYRRPPIQVFSSRMTREPRLTPRSAHLSAVEQCNRYWTTRGTLRRRISSSSRRSGLVSSKSAMSATSCKDLSSFEVVSGEVRQNARGGDGEVSGSYQWDKRGSHPTLFPLSFERKISSLSLFF